MMNQRTIVLSGSLVVMGLVYVFGFSNWFKSDELSITHRLERPQRVNPRNPPATLAVRFGMDDKYTLQSIRVVRADSETQDAQDAARWGLGQAPLWHVVADNERPEKTQVFYYGQRIRGMRPADEDQARPQPLEPDVTYVLYVQAGSKTARYEFTTEAFRR